MVAPAVRLNPDEKIVLDVLPSVFWTAQLYLGTLGFWAIWRRRHHFLLTNQRVMIVLGIVNKHERSVPLSRIQDISLHRSLLEGGHVALSSAGGSLGIEQIGPLTRNGAHEFAGRALGAPPSPARRWSLDTASCGQRGLFGRR